MVNRALYYTTAKLKLQLYTSTKKHSLIVLRTGVIIQENLDKDETDEIHENTENKG